MEAADALDQAGRQLQPALGLCEAGPPGSPRGANTRLAQKCHRSVSSWPGWSAKDCGRPPEADRNTLIRRVSLDLTGLPPTSEEVQAIRERPGSEGLREAGRSAAGKQAPTANTGPTCGSTWRAMPIRPAMPTIRRAPSGSTAITSSSRSTPTSRSTSSPSSKSPATCCPNPTDEQLIATAFHRNTLTNNEGGTIDEEFRNVAVVDRVEHHDGGLDGHDDGLRPVPQPQIRSDHAGGILPLLRVLQQHRGRRPDRRIARTIHVHQ